MYYRYRRWVDFGASGCNPIDITLEYNADHDYQFPKGGESVLEDRWTQIEKTKNYLHDAPGINLIDVSDRRLELGPSRFRDYFLRRLILSNDELLNDIPIPVEVKQRLVDAVHYLSSFVGVITKDQLLVGIKPGGTGRPPLFSLPGSGYLDRDQDMHGSCMAPTHAIINRELEEEVGINAGTNQIRCLGIFEDLAPASHQNPALFSLILTEEPQSKVLRGFHQAPDSDEFREVALLPVTEEAIESLIGSTVDPSRLDSLQIDFSLTEDVEMSHKTLLMLLLLGRQRFGLEWFHRTWAQHTAFRFENPEN